MRANHVKRRLAAGEPSIGTWLALPSPECAEYVGTVGFDWLVVDLEHNTIDVRTMGQMFSMLAHSSAAPMARIPWNTPEHFKRVLDAGAWGIVVPMVNSRAEAEQAAAAMCYPPRGIRSVGGSRPALSFNTSADQYYQHANDQLLLVVQIEHIEAVQHVDEILSVPGIDACFIGPNDLAASMGIGVGVPLESDHPQMVEAIDTILAACKRNGVAPGIHCSGAAGVRQRLEQGFQFCAMASDLKYLLSGLQSDLAHIDWQPSRAETIQDQTEGAVVRY